MRIPTMPSAAAPTEAVSLARRGLRLPAWLLATLLGVLTLALYWPVTQNAFINYDDPVYVTENYQVQKGLTWENLQWVFSHQVCANWHPVTILSHMLDCQLYGLHSGGHHLTNLLLHALNTVLVFLLLHRLTRIPGRSAWVAVLFACHPTHVESVAWVAERKDMLCAMFGFLALLFYVQYASVRSPSNQAAAGGPGPTAGSSHPWPFYWLAWSSLALGLMCKPMLVTWPFVLLLLDYWPLARFQPGRARTLWFEKIPFFALAVAASVATFAVQKRSGAVAAIDGMPLGMRVANALVSYGRYLGKLFWPQDLAVFYPHRGYWPLSGVLLAGGLLAGLTVLACLARRRTPFLLVGWLWFVGTLVPVIGLVQVGGQSLADRYTYIPSVGLLVLIIWGICDLIGYWRLNLRLAATVGAAAVILCCALTRQQIGYWKNSETLFRHSLAVTKDNEIARNNLGDALLAQGQTTAAISEFAAAVRLNPRSVLVHLSLGSALCKQGDPEAAIHEFEAALRLDPNNANAHGNLGCVLAEKGQTTAAVKHFQLAFRADPDYADAHFNLGNALTKLGDADGAMREFQTVLRLKPGDTEAHYKLGNLLARKGRNDDAIREFQEAVRLKPDFTEAHGNLGSLLTQQGQTDAAIRHFQEALRLKPDYAEASYNLANVYLKAGQPDLAVSQYQAALNGMTNFAPAHYYLGVALARQNQTDAAIQQYQAALRIKPDYAAASNSLARALEMKNAPTNQAAPGLK